VSAPGLDPFRFLSHPAQADKGLPALSNTTPESDVSFLLPVGGREEFSGPHRPPTGRDTNWNVGEDQVAPSANKVAGKHLPWILRYPAHSSRGVRPALIAGRTSPDLSDAFLALYSRQHNGHDMVRQDTERIFDPADHQIFALASSAETYDDQRQRHLVREKYKPENTAEIDVTQAQAHERQP